VLLVLAVVSTLLLPVMEVEAVSDEYVYADRIFGDAAWWLRSRPSCRRCWPWASRRLHPLPAGSRPSLLLARREAGRRGLLQCQDSFTNSGHLTRCEYELCAVAPGG
jgi:hypothetical protein